jgi:hypothetical protein
LTVDFSASFGTPVSLGVNGTVAADGSFRITVASPSGGGTYTSSSGNLSLGAVKFRGALSYRISVTISSGSPYVAASADGSAAIQEEHWWFFHWRGWNNLLSVGLRFSINPWSLWVSFHALGFSVTLHF